MRKENKYKSLFERMNADEEQAKVDYARIMEEDKDKNYMDILPAEFKTFKKSILKRQVLRYIDSTTQFLNTCGLYKGRIFDKKEVVRYMMRGTDYSNFYLAYMFIPRKDSTSLWMKYAISYRKETGKDPSYEEFAKKDNEILETYRELEYQLQCLKQVWEQYEDRQKVKKGKLVKDYDIEKDGFPRTSRGNMCYLFIPVKGKFPKNKAGNFKLYNPRSKKEETFEIISYKSEDEIYSCLNEKGKKVFLADYQSVADSWDALFASNKEVYSGWWNKVMILK